MTRGTFYLILPKTVYESTEFNGDMYPDGYGDNALKMLKDVNTLQEFKSMVKEFNDGHHQYKDKLVHKMDRYTNLKTYKNRNREYQLVNGMFEGDDTINFKNSYFDRFFSDWLFIKNKSNRIIPITDADDKGHLIDKNETIRLNFGRWHDEDSYRIEKEKLEESTTADEFNLNYITNRDPGDENS